MSESAPLAGDAQLEALRAKLGGSADGTNTQVASRNQLPFGVVTVKSAAARCDIKPATIRKWLERGKLTACGYDQSGRALVVLGEIERLAFHDPVVLLQKPGTLMYPAGFHTPIPRPDGDPTLHPYEEHPYDLHDIELITIAQAGHHFNVSPSTVRSWASRGYIGDDGSRQRLRAVEINGCREKLYDYNDVARAARATAKRGGRVRNYSPEFLARWQAASSAPESDIE